MLTLHFAVYISILKILPHSLLWTCRSFKVYYSDMRHDDSSKRTLWKIVRADIEIKVNHTEVWGFPGSASGKESTCQCRSKRCRFDSGWGRSLEEGTATHSSFLAWRIPWTEKPGGATVHRITKSQTWLKRLNKAQHRGLILIGVGMIL